MNFLDHEDERPVIDNLLRAYRTPPPASAGKREFDGLLDRLRVALAGEDRAAEDRRARRG